MEVSRRAPSPARKGTPRASQHTKTPTGAWLRSYNWQELHTGSPARGQGVTCTTGQVGSCDRGRGDEGVKGTSHLILEHHRERAGRGMQERAEPRGAGERRQLGTGRWSGMAETDRASTGETTWGAVLEESGAVPRERLLPQPSSRAFWCHWGTQRGNFPREPPLCPRASQRNTL